MSDREFAALTGADGVEAVRAGDALIESGRAVDVAQAMLDELLSESSWRSDRARERLAALTRGPELLVPLVDGLRDERHADLRNAARSALAALAAPESAAREEAMAELVRLLADAGDPDVPIMAASALGESGNPRAREALEAALASDDENLASAAADALGVLGDSRAVPALAAAMDRPFWVAASAVVALGRIGETAAVGPLSRAAATPALAAIAATALGEMGARSGLDALEAAAATGAEGRAAALDAAIDILARNPDARPPEWLRELARPGVAAAAERFVETGDERAARLLGIAGTEEAARALLGELGSWGHEAPAARGVALLPDTLASQVIFDNLDGADAEGCKLLFGALPPLRRALDAVRVAGYLGSHDEELRAAAAEALARSEPGAVEPALEAALADPALRAGAVDAYARMPNVPCAPLEAVLDDADPRIRLAAAEGLARCGGGDVRTVSTALNAEADSRARAALVHALGASRSPEAVVELSSLLRGDDPALRFEAVRALGESHAPEALGPLLDALRDDDRNIRAAALDALGRLGDARAADPLSRGLDESDRDLRRTAVFALDRVATPRAMERLTGALDDPDREVRITAARIIGRIGDEDALSAVERLADSDPDPLVRRAACRAIDERRERSSGTG